MADVTNLDDDLKTIGYDMYIAAIVTDTEDLEAIHAVKDGVVGAAYHWQWRLQLQATTRRNS